MLKVEEELIGELDGKVINLSRIVKSVGKDLDKIPDIEAKVKKLNTSMKDLQDIVLKITQKSK